jgi:hypothetical protein
VQEKKVLCTRASLNKEDTSQNTNMDTIQKLIDREEMLKDKIKATRIALKAALIESEVYKAVLEATLEEKDGFTVTEKMAKAHALKVARATYENLEEEEAEN